MTHNEHLNIFASFNASRRGITGELGAATSCPPSSEGAGRRRTPVMEQRAVLRPYLHELDCFMEQLITDFEKGRERAKNPEYHAISRQVAVLNKAIQQTSNPSIRAQLVERKKKAQQNLMTMPSTDHYDPNYRRLRYCRYADDFLL